VHFCCFISTTTHVTAFSIFCALRFFRLLRQSELSPNPDDLPQPPLLQTSEGSLHLHFLRVCHDVLLTRCKQCLSVGRLNCCWSGQRRKSWFRVPRDYGLHFTVPTLRLVKAVHTYITYIHDLSPRANYTDRATAASRRSGCQFLRIKGATWSA
jgi:hypothetical protein